MPAREKVHDPTTVFQLYIRVKRAARKERGGCLTFNEPHSYFWQFRQQGGPVSFKPTQKAPVTRFSGGNFSKENLTVVCERPLTLFLNEKEVVTLMTNGEHPRELAAGFFHSEGFIEGPDDIAELTFEENRSACRLIPSVPIEFSQDVHGRRLITTGCGKGSVYYGLLEKIKSGKVRVKSDLVIEPGKLVDLIRENSKSSELSKQTHGVHTAALCSIDGSLISRDDVGRHNAIEKVVGHCLLSSIPPTDKILFTTGRLTSEVVMKVARFGCPMVISRSSASSLALELAEITELTLVGGARAGRFHVYTYPRRIHGAD